MLSPPRPHARAPFADGGDVVLGHRDVEDRAGPSNRRRIEVRPFVDACGELLKERGDGCWWDAAFEDEIEAGQVNEDRFVGMAATGVLDGVGVDSQLMHLSNSTALLNSAPITSVKTLQHSGEALK